MSAATFLARRLILVLAFDTARKTLAQQPFTFAVSYPVHGRAALVAAVRSRRAGGFPHRLITAGPIAKNFGMPSFCVTTRGPGGGRRALALLGPFGRLRLPLASLAFRFGMPAAPFVAGAAFLLTLGGLPAAQFPAAFRVLAVALVLPSGVEPPAAAFTEARSPPPPPPSPPGGNTPSLGMLNLSHGR